MQIKGIKYIALLPPEGYGVAAKRLILALAETGIPITFTPLVPGGSWDLYFEKYQGASLLDKDLEPLCNKKIDYDWVIIHTTPEFYPNCVKEEQGKKIIAHTVWETDKIPSSWHNYFQGINRIIDLHINSDCFISPSHGEGWGLGAFDAATLGNPVIMTRFGGPLAFLQPELSYLVNYSIVPANAKGHEKYIFTADQNWCAPDSKYAVELMRQVYENQTPAKEKAIKLQQQIKEKFSAEAVVQQLLAILSRN